MFKTILVPDDGSALSARALPFAVRLATTTRGRIDIVWAYLPSAGDLLLRIEHPDSGHAERARVERSRAQAEFAEQIEQLGEQDCPVQGHFIDGPAASAIVETAREVQADIIVMSTHGRGGLGRWLYGSVAADVLRRASLPVLLVSATCKADWSGSKPRRVLVPLDGSDLATEMLQSAARLADGLGGAEIILLAVVEPLVAMYPEGAMWDLPHPASEGSEAAAYLEAVMSQFAGSAPGRVTRRVAFGEAAPTITSIAREAEVDAIAMATHGRTGIAQWLFGNVTARTLQLASVPLLVYRPTLLRAPRREQSVDNGSGRPLASAPSA